MKQINLLLLLALFSFIAYSSYDVFIKKNYKSDYKQIVSTQGVTISKIKFDKEKIDRLNENIKKLKQDPTYKLKLTNIKGSWQQPLFLDKYNKIYDKILLQQRLSNNYE